MIANPARVLVALFIVKTILTNRSFRSAYVISRWFQLSGIAHRLIYPLVSSSLSRVSHPPTSQKSCPLSFLRQSFSHQYSYTFPVMSVSTHKERSRFPRLDISVILRSSRSRLGHVRMSHCEHSRELLECFAF